MLSSIWLPIILTVIYYLIIQSAIQGDIKGNCYFILFSFLLQEGVNCDKDYLNYCGWGYTMTIQYWVFENVQELQDQNVKVDLV